MVMEWFLLIKAKNKFLVCYQSKTRPRNSFTVVLARVLIEKIQHSMETYHRRRYKKAKQANFEMEYSKEQGQNGISGAVSPALPRHDFVPPPLPKSDHYLFQHNDVDDEVPASIDSLFNNIESVEVGSVYEIDHIHLPPRTPVQLRSIRVAMVSEKARMNVALRFPSMESLKTYFSNSIREMYPELDEKFVMGTALAAKVLLRQVPSHEFAGKKHLEGFWLVNAARVYESAGEEDDISKKGTCWPELKCDGMVRWGIRRQVKFLERNKENTSFNVQSSSSFVKGSEEIKIDAFGKKEDDNENDEEEEEDDNNDNEDDDDNQEDGKYEVDIADEEALTEETQETDRNLKRKRYKLRNITIRQKAKTVKRKKKRPKKSHGNKGRNKCRELLELQNPGDRWSAERYQLATKNLLEVMRDKGATAGFPILRPDLRAEARKRIGDTGLLDHLLKHMAGKIAPGGAERFRRRHNADGAMEYWLESSDLVNIRMEAGVNDPYWIPPPGWMPGDCPTQDPICAKELRLLKEEIFRLEKNAQEMMPRKQVQEEVLKLRREIEELVPSKKQKENHAIQVLTNPCCIGQKLDHLANSLVTSKSDLAKTPNLMEKFEEQLMVISDFVKGIEQEIKNLTSKGKEKTLSDSALMVSTESRAEKEKRHLAMEQKGKEQEVQELVLIGEEDSAATKTEKATTAVAAATAEKKAAKIERLKSGFRICKPQGTFLWPNMARNNCNNAAAMSNSVLVTQPPQVVVQVEDLFVVPTPPSVSSSSALAPPQLPYHSNNQHHPASPVKPLAERRAVTVTVSTLPNEHGDQGLSTTTKATTTTKKNPNGINLNDIPCNSVEGFYGTQLNVTTNTVMPRLLPDTTVRKEMNQMMAPWDAMTGCAGTATSISGAREETGSGKQRLSKCCSSSASCMSAEAGNWLALATATSASDESSQG